MTRRNSGVKLISFLIALMFFMGMIVPSAFLFSENAYADTDNDEISIIFTNDMHSTLTESETEEDGEETEVGGFARVMTTIENLKQEDDEAIVVDAGNYSMGGAYGVICPVDAPELVLMAKMGYDVVNLGTDEQKEGESALANMLAVAKEDGEGPTLTSSEYNWDTYSWETIEEPEYEAPKIATSLASDEDTGKELKSALEDYGASNYQIITSGERKIAVFGVTGDASEQAADTIKQIKEESDIELIVCLSDGGTDDTKLAKDNPDIDVLVSARRDSALQEPEQQGDTLIVSADPDTASVGNIVLDKVDGEYELKEYEIISQDSDVSQDYDIKQDAEDFEEAIDKDYYSKYGFDNDDVVAKLTKKMDSKTALAQLFSDAYLSSGKDVTGDETAISIVSEQSVKDAKLAKGDITASDLFDLCDKSYGTDDRPGSYLVNVYLTGKEIKAIAEADRSLSGDEDLNYEFGGLTFSYNDHRVKYNKVLDVKIENNGESEKIDDDELYSVITDKYTYDTFAKLEDKSNGYLTAYPKDKSGNELTKASAAAIQDGKNDLKIWSAVAEFTSGLSGKTVPDTYYKADGRKVDDTSWNPIKIFKGINKFGIARVLLFVIPILIIIVIIIIVRHRKRKRRGYKRSMFASAGRSRYGSRYKSKYSNRRFGKRKRRWKL